jgi:hypothetical protein
MFHDDFALALFSPSLPRSYHFGAATATTSMKVTNADLRQRQPKPYVPDGLTEEQYRKIKADELVKMQRMNFGAWGPRFKRVDGDPDSNWFNLPSLWTGGYSANTNDKPGRKNSENCNVGIENAFAVYLRRYGFAYLLLLLSAELWTRSLSSKQVLSSKWLAARVLVPFAILKPLSALAAIFADLLRMRSLKKDGIMNLMSVAVAVLATLSSLALRWGAIHGDLKSWD